MPPRGRKPTISEEKPFIKCSLQLEPEHVQLLEEIKRQLGTESRSEALRAVFDSGVLADLEFCFDTSEAGETIEIVDEIPQSARLANAPLMLAAPTD